MLELATLEKSSNRNRRKFDKFSIPLVTNKADKAPPPEYHASIDEKSLMRSRYRGAMVDLFHPNFIEMMDKAIGREKEIGENSDRMRCVTERGGHEITPRKLIDQYG
jgi:hypothetical protein